MPFNPFAMNKKDNPRIGSFFRISLLAAVLLMVAGPSPSLAGKIVVIGGPDRKDDSCPSGKQCEPASPGEQNRSSDSAAGKNDAIMDTPVFGGYVKSYFEAGKTNKQAAISDDGTEDDKTSKQAAVSGDGAEEDSDAGVQALSNDSDDEDSGITIFGAVASSGAARTSGNTVLLGGGMITETVSNNYVSNSYATSAGSSVPGTANAAMPSNTGDPARATWAIPSLPRFDLGLNSASSSPAQEPEKAELWGKAPTRRPQAEAGSPATAVATTNFGDSRYAGASAIDSGPGYRTGSSGVRNDVTQSTSLSSGRDLELGNLSFKDFFNPVGEREKSETQSTVILILVGVGILQALVLGATVFRALAGSRRAR
ncbi:MAG: hypothetical protein FWD79_00405 [Desulfobulbus sp.]|nr:hypothetical protein [Desulfobulbus sp.]